MRAYLVAAVLLLLIFGSISGYLYQRVSALASADYSPPPVTVTADQAGEEDWDNTLEAVGTIKARRGVDLSTEASGEVTAIDVTSGEQVRQGQLLITLNDKVEQASRERQIANLKLARLLFERDAQLVTQNTIPQSQYDRSRADLDSAVAQLAEIEALLENKQVHAPFDGTVGILHVKVGDYLEPGTRITTLQDLSDLEVDFTLPARHYPQLAIGQAVLVDVAAYPGVRFPATLLALDSQVEADTRNLLLRARLSESGGLLPGMFARLHLNLGNARTLVTVPETAVTYSLHGNTVWTVAEREGELRVISRIVKTGESRDGRLAILSGLEAGTQVVTSGQNKLYRDARVLLDDAGVPAP